ncbi:Hypothetical predicted protein [Lecanosticta acicola]|uniref:Uncharacterized protein n=1 Tax=Lecanosticta acicola TaxID=111012 RepID=A0AAI8Z7D7_9PEZI|nr:Hypothetical predicted protein [Lecanosticta acicola]
MSPSPFFPAILSLACLWITALADTQHGLQLKLSLADGLVSSSVTGRVLVLFAPLGVDPLASTDVASTPDYFYGKNVFNLNAGDTVTLSGGSGSDTSYGVWGFPNASLDDLPTGQYTVQAFLNRYETVTRSDGSQISVRFPCGDGQPPIDAPGSLLTPVTNITISGNSQTVKLTFDDTVPPLTFYGKEIGGCLQGNFNDTELLKHIKIRSDALSKFWNRDMYVGATVLLPHGYQASDTSTRYPVIYSQNHWAGGQTAFLQYDETYNWVDPWYNGTIPGVNGTADRKTPRLILVSFRHESPYYDNSYGVNTANFGPYGDAINEELIPHIDKLFNTIAKPYARIQEGGSTGGWVSAANVIFRPDLFGACFSSYPDPLDFHRHQDIPLYDATNAYTRPDGSKIYSFRDVVDGTLTNVDTVEEENHWELSQGTSSRSALQWDVWNAVFGVQGLNGYPLEPWDKVTGEIYPEAVEFWKSMDLSNYITSNWDNEKDLGTVLRNRIFIYVGSWDNYFLNEGVEEFRKRVSAKGGSDWANVTVFADEPHEDGLYQKREIWNYLEFLEGWIRDHSPSGKTPLSDAVTTSKARGNLWSDVIARGGHQAALARQAAPELKVGKAGLEASPGRWDPGVVLTAQWVVDGKASGEAFNVKQGDVVAYKATSQSRKGAVQLAVTGRKRGYSDETRKSNALETTL